MNATVLFDAMLCLGCVLLSAATTLLVLLALIGRMERVDD